MRICESAAHRGEWWGLFGWGVPKTPSAPKRERSYRLHAVDMSSMPQHAVANGIGQTDDRRAQFITRFSCVVINPSTGRAASRPIGRSLLGGS